MDLIIQEARERPKVSILEATGDRPKEYWIEGIFLQAELKNGNDRIYPLKVLQEAVSEYEKEYIKTRRALGELGHPETPGIHWEQVCLNVESVKQDGNNFIGRAKIIGTPAGKIVQCLIDEGIQLAVSSRGRGEVRNGIVQNGFQLVSLIDIVHEPSAPEAFVQALAEKKEWVMENGVLTEREMDALRQNVEKANSRRRALAKAEAYKKFFEAISAR